MFFLVPVRDSMRLVPTTFYKRHEDALSDWVASKYVNRVLEGTGLCVGVDDMLEAARPVLQPGDGAKHVRARFTLVVFRPFEKEVLTGRVIQSDSTGLIVTLGFFTNVFVPNENLPENTVFREESKKWWYLGDSEDGGDEEPEAIDEDVRVLVKRVVFAKQLGGADNDDEDDEDASPAARAAAERKRAAANAVPQNIKEMAERSPMMVLGSVSGNGLGPVHWWDDAGDEDSEEEGGQEEDMGGEE